MRKYSAGVDAINRQRTVEGDNQTINTMTGDQSRSLEVYERVCWEKSATDLGTVVSSGLLGVAINWDDGYTASIHHNDMAQVDRVPTQIL